MAARLERINAFLDGTRRTKREIVTPEGVALEIEIATIGERLLAFTLDLFFWAAGLVFCFLLIGALLRADVNFNFALTVFFLISFLVRNFYFTHFELTTQGSTPGKRIVGLKVIDFKGGALAPSGVIARNLTREIETFLPLSLAFSVGEGGFSTLAALGWVGIVATLPFFNMERRRAGDLIGGTMVIAVPKQKLLAEIADARDRYRFTRAQLAAYGAFELQVLEEILRRPPGVDTSAILRDICSKIAKKIAWPGDPPLDDAKTFLTEFYAAERAHLEREQLFGKYKADKASEPVGLG